MNEEEFWIEALDLIEVFIKICILNYLKFYY